MKITATGRSSRLPTALYYIAYFHEGLPGEPPPEPERHPSLREVTDAFRKFVRDTGRGYYDIDGTARALLYPCDSEEEWAEAQRFAGIGCPFDYPGYVLSIGPRGGIQRERC
jgi:hypothetical protein